MANDATRKGMTESDRQRELAQMIDAATRLPGVVDVLAVYGQSAHVLEQISAYLQPRVGVKTFGTVARTA